MGIALDVRLVVGCLEAVEGVFVSGLVVPPVCLLIKICRGDSQLDEEEGPVFRDIKLSLALQIIVLKARKDGDQVGHRVGVLEVVEVIVPHL